MSSLRLPMFKQWKLGLVGLAWLALLALGVGAARAQGEEALPPGLAASGLCGLTQAEYPTCQPYFVGVSANAGYGYTEAFGPFSSGHSRLLGSLGAGVVPLDWLAVSLRLDGRYDRHPSDVRGADQTWIGDPRLSVRAGREVARGVTVGGSLGLWVPGQDAPSFQLKATTLDLKALAAYRRARWSVLGSLGFRLDNSSNSVPDDRARLRRGDALSLGLSDAHAVLLVVGGAYRLSARYELFVDLSADLLVGEKAPALNRSPMRASLGGRMFLPKQLQVEVTLTSSLSARPSMRPTAALVPIEPRLALSVGLRWGMMRKGAPQRVAEELPGLGAENEPGSAPAVQLASVRGSVTDEQGEALPEVLLRLALAEGEPREAFSDADGNYSFSDMPAGKATLEASAAGFKPHTAELEIGAALVSVPPIQMVAKAEMGLLRCLTRSFRSEPLKAQIVVRDARNREVLRGQADATGKFEAELPGGTYQVIISAPGYRTHRRKVDVSNNGVAILNVDMRESHE